MYQKVGIDNSNLDCKLLHNSIGGQKGTRICKHYDVTSPSVALTAWKMSLKIEGTNKNLINQQMLKNCRKWTEEKLAKKKTQCKFTK